MDNFKIGATILVTCSNWFTAPDGRQYQAAWGTVRGVYSAKETVGRMPNTQADWLLEIGCMLIAGCQINYAIACGRPDTEKHQAWGVKEGAFFEYMEPTRIWIAD